MLFEILSKRETRLVNTIEQVIDILRDELGVELALNPRETGLAVSIMFLPKDEPLLLEDSNDEEVKVVKI